MRDRATPVASRARQMTTLATRLLLAGAFVAEGWVEPRTRRVSTTSTATSSMQVVAAYDARRRRHALRLSSGRIASGQQAARARRPGRRPRSAPEPAGRAERVAERGEAHPGVRVARGGGVEARVPAGALRRATARASLSAARTRSRSRTRPAATQLASDVQQLLLEFGVVSPLGPVRQGRDQGRDHQPARRAAVRSATWASSAPSRRSSSAILATIPTSSRALTPRPRPVRGGLHQRPRAVARGRTSDWLRAAQRRPRSSAGSGAARRSSSGSRPMRSSASIEPLVTGEYYYAEVESVTDAGVQPVYSLRVDTDDHSFLDRRLRQPQHRGAARAARRGDAARARLRHRRLRAELRRVEARAARAAGAASRTCSSTAPPGSPSAWRRTSRRTTSARSSTRSSR